MRVAVPDDHGATDVLCEERDAVVARPHDWPEDTYPALWFNFEVHNDTGADLEPAVVRIENLPTGAETYEPFWRYCLWSQDGGLTWRRIPEELQAYEETALELRMPLSAGARVHIAETIPHPYSHYVALDVLLTRFRTDGVKFDCMTPGTTTGGRPIHAYRVRRESGSAARNILVVAGQHAVEQSGKALAEVLLTGYHSGCFVGDPLGRLLETHNVVVVPMANPDGCYDGRMNTNAEGVVMDAPDDDSAEMQAVMALVDEFRPEVMVNCHGWGNEVGEPPYEDVYRWTDEDPLFVWLKKHVPGCSSSGAPHLIGDAFRLENYARERHGTECVITEVNWNWQVRPHGGPAFSPGRGDIEDRGLAYMAAVAEYCMR